MNNSKLEVNSPVISTMASGLRADAWHWRDSDVSGFSSEKLTSILSLSASARDESDLEALRRVQLELEKRARQLVSQRS